MLHPVALSLALALSPAHQARELSHPSHARRAAASATLGRLGARATPVLAALWNHRDLEVRLRVRDAWAASRLIPAPPDGRWPWPYELAAVLPAPLGRAVNHIYYRWGTSLAGDAWTQATIDGLTLRGFPPPLAARWVDAANRWRTQGAQAAPALAPTWRRLAAIVAPD